MMNAPLSPRPKSWLVESILATIFCCMPLGIVGIINAASVNSRFDRGDYVGAERASTEAGKWTKISFFVGLVVIVLVIILNFVVGGAAVLQGLQDQGSGDW